MSNGEKNKKTYLIVGLGRFGKSLAFRLAESGAHIIAVDKIKAHVDDVADKLEYVGQLDATEEAALVKIGAKDADVAVICLGEKTEATILVTAILLDLGIARVIARANNDLQARILSKIGAHEVIAPEVEMGRRIADRLENPWMASFSEFDDDDHIAGKFKVLGDMVGRSLKELALPAAYGTMVLVVDREGKKMRPHADLVIREGDSIWLFGERSRMKLLLEKIQPAKEEKMEERK